MRDEMNDMHLASAIPPVAAAPTGDTAIVSSIIDRKGYDSLTFAIITGSLADADATFAVTMEDGDASNLSDTAAVVAAEIVGTYALAGFTFALDNGCRKIGYRGHKRYVRLTITPSNNSGNSCIAAVAILENGAILPTANPPA